MLVMEEGPLGGSLLAPLLEVCSLLSEKVSAFCFILKLVDVFYLLAEAGFEGLVFSFFLYSLLDWDSLIILFIFWSSRRAFFFSEED
jgi:hypothetical protein